MHKNIFKKPYELGLLLVIFNVIAAVPASTSDHTNITSDVLTITAPEVKVVRLRNLWKIKNFNSLNLTLGQKLTSPPFSAETQDDCNWKLDFYPSGINQESKAYVALFLTSLSCNVSADIRISFLNTTREQIYKREFLHDFSKTKTIGFNSFVKRDLLLNKKKNVLLNNTLTIFCEVNATLVEKRSLGKDLAVLLENHAFSNFIISAGGKDFQTHKSILAARSPVFRAMFEHNMKKKKIARVDLNDVEQKVMKKFLRYIYTGDASNLENLAPKLLAVADKYKVNGLKTICENAMAANLTVENSAEYYILGEKHSAVNLKTLARAFVVAHASEVVKTPGFKLLIKAHPDLVDEIFSAVIAGR